MRQGIRVSRRLEGSPEGIDIPRPHPVRPLSIIGIIQVPTHLEE